jgi:RNA-binding protein 39
LTAQARATISARLGAATVSKALQLSSVISQSVAASVAAKSSTTAASGDTTNMPSNCVVISNAFDPNTETEPTWPADILTDINAELAHHGKVVFSKLDPKDGRGLVFAMLADDVQARGAIVGLAGRGFGGRTLGAHAVPILDFLQRYPESAAAAAGLVV